MDGIESWVQQEKKKITSKNKRLEMQHEIYTLLMAIALRKFKHAQEQSQLDGISYGTLEEAWDYANDKMEDGYAHIAREIRHVRHLFLNILP